MVIGCRDTFEKVDGQGIERLKDAGIEVVVGVMEKECRKLNARFFTSIEKKRPYVILKWAQTQDGFIARENYDSKWISNQYSRQLVHKWRSEEDAILVGKNTAKFDNPSLTVRDWKGRNPTRIVLDNKLELASDLALFDRSVPTIVMNASKENIQENLSHIKYEGSISDLLSQLNELKIQSLIVEGGAKVSTAFIDQGLWDEARVFISTENFGSGIEAPIIGGILVSNSMETGDRLEIYERVH